MAGSTAGPGHNSGGIAGAQLRAFIERIERLEEEKKALADDLRDVYAEAKGNGFDTKTMRAVVRLRKQDASDRAEQEALLDTYLHALGMLADTPLGMASARGEFGPQVDIEDAIARTADPAEPPKPPRKKMTPAERAKARDDFDNALARGAKLPPYPDHGDDGRADGQPLATADPVGADLTGPDEDEATTAPEITGALDAAEGALA